MLRRALATGVILAAGCTSAPACDLSGAALQARVVAIVSKDFPQRDARPGEDVDVVVSGGAELGLTNLRARICQVAPHGGPAADTLIREHLTIIFASLDAQVASGRLTWDEARPRLRLQLMPAEYVTDREPRLISRAYVPGVVMGVVVDDATSYRYVTDDDVQRWGKSANEAFDAAIVSGKPVDIEQPGDGMLAIATGSGFDAAQILHRAVRAQAAAALGDPFIAAFPNRDFLVMWRAEGDPALHARLATQVRADCASQSHPLACDTYRVWVDGRIEPVARPVR